MATILASNAKRVEATLNVESDWHNSLRRAIRSSRELLEMLDLPENLGSAEAATDFPVFAPLEYVLRMRPGDPNDPLLRQVLATAEELSAPTLEPSAVYHELATPSRDPVGDAAAKRTDGLLQKYRGRALLIASGACAIHCRYCFRRHFPYETAGTGKAGWQPSLDWIRQDDSLEEIILSGGDPLSITDAQLAWLVAELSAIPHLKRLRIHTRFPVVIPGRVTDGLLACLDESPLATFMVLHFNHVNEIDASVGTALKRLRCAGISLLNQAVFIRGVNDTPLAQLDLCRALINQQVIPYYLHQLDRVQGAMHFETTEAEGHAIVRHLREHLPGYAVPNYVREIAGQPSKTPLLG